MIFVVLLQDSLGILSRVKGQKEAVRIHIPIREVHSWDLRASHLLKVHDTCQECSLRPEQ